MGENTRQTEAAAEQSQEATRPKFMQKFVKNRLSIVGLMMIGMVFLGSYVYPNLVPCDPDKQNLPESLNPPSREHPFGSDLHGRDLLCRVLYGTRVSIAVGIGGVLLGVALGSVIGLLAGYHGGTVDAVIMRTVDGLLAFPAMLSAIAIAAILGVGLGTVTVAICVYQVPIFVRLVRGIVLSIRERDYIRAARAIGASDLRILTRHIVPNCIAPLAVQASLSCGWGILTVAWMSFLGLGVQPPTPELGSLVSEGRDYLREAPYLSAFPGMVITIMVLGLNFIGGGLRDALDVKIF